MLKFLNTIAGFVLFFICMWIDKEILEAWIVGRIDWWMVLFGIPFFLLATDSLVKIWDLWFPEMKGVK